MSNLSHFGYSSVSSFDSCAQDKELICAQIDRLNSVIQNLAFESFSPGISNYIYTSSIDSFNDFSKRSLEYYEDENIYKSIENTLVELDRALMVTEDFRTMEVRRFEKTQFEENLNIEVSLQEVVELVDELKEIVADGLSQKKVQIGSRAVKLSIREEDFEVDKRIIGEFLARPVENYQTTGKNKFDLDLEECMKKAFDELILTGKTNILNSNNFVSQADCAKVLTQKSQQQRLIEKLEWQCFEFKFAKSQLEKKFKKIPENYKKGQNATENPSNPTKPQETLVFIPFPTKPSFLISQKSSENRPPIADHKVETETEMKILQNEIAKLEYQLKKDKQNGESIQLKIDRLKTQQSKLKTLKVMKESVERSNSFASRLKLCRNVERPLRTSKRPLLNITNLC